MKQLAPLVFFVALPVLAAVPEIPVAEAIVFKNGLAFLTRQGPLAFRDGQASVAPAPEALLGTLWIAAGNRRIDVVRASKETISVESAATSVTALLDANAGRMVTLLVDNREYTGKLLAAPAPEPPTSSPEAVAVMYGSRVVPVNAEVQGLVLLEVDGKVRAFNRGDVKSVAFAAPPVLSAARAATRAALSIRAGSGDGTEAATIRYLRSGISWIPEYTIELLDQERARVVMKATLINDGEDLRNARLRFAVGFPNFSFAGVASPMTLQQTLQEFLGRLGGDASGTSRRFDNVMTQQVMTNSATFIGDSATVLPGPPTTGESAEDLFFYEKEGVTLAKGERALYPILNEVVPMRHLYRWTIPDENEQTRYVARNALEDQVWHSISLTNSGTTPWTTAPALVVSNGKPLAQDTLAYTAAGADGEVKLTIATDVAVERTEEEVERKPRDLQRFGYTWDVVTIEGTLTIRSFKRQPITLEITKNVNGQSIQRVPEAEVTRLAQEPKAVNVSERLEWRLPLPAGETVTVRYRYKVWVKE